MLSTAVDVNMRGARNFGNHTPHPPSAPPATDRPELDHAVRPGRQRTVSRRTPDIVRRAARVDFPPAEETAWSADGAPVDYATMRHAATAFRDPGSLLMRASTNPGGSSNDPVSSAADGPPPVWSPQRERSRGSTAICSVAICSARRPCAMPFENACAARMPCSCSKTPSPSATAPPRQLPAAGRGPLHPLSAIRARAARSRTTSRSRSFRICGAISRPMIAAHTI